MHQVLEKSSIKSWLWSVVNELTSVELTVSLLVLVVVLAFAFLICVMMIGVAMMAMMSSPMKMMQHIFYIVDVLPSYFSCVSPSPPPALPLPSARNLWPSPHS